jgi:AbrB family looped-hinge helix DNA binding protein
MSAKQEWLMQEFIHGNVSGAGRVVVPAELRKEFGIENGKEVIFSRSEYGIQITPFDQAVLQAQALVRRYVPKGVSLVDDLHETRRKDPTFV